MPSAAAAEGQEPLERRVRPAAEGEAVRRTAWRRPGAEAGAGVVRCAARRRRRWRGAEAGEGVAVALRVLVGRVTTLRELGVDEGAIGVKVDG